MKYIAVCYMKSSSRAL